jgi:hypothetical protein
MVRSLPSLLACAALTVSLFTAVYASPITILPNTVQSFRESRGVNDLGLIPGERNQFGADIIPSAGSTITAVQAGFTAGPIVCAPLTVNPNICVNTTAFNSSRLGSWSLTFQNGTDTAVITTPTLIGAEAAVPFPQNVTITGGDHPTISFTIPAGFTPDALRALVYDKSVTLPNGVKGDNIFSQPVAASATSFTIPSSLTLKPGNPYAIGFQVIDLRPGFTEADFVASNSNAMILRRSNSFFDFQILPPGAPPVVELPTVGPDPNPNDAFGAPYQFSFSITNNQMHFLDPLIAIGYDYTIGAGNPNFASVIFPNVGDGLFDLTFGSTTQTVASGVEFFFPVGGVSHFSVRGIETSVGLDPGNVTAFITGLTWVGLGEFTGTMTPFIQLAPQAAVPFPGSLVLFAIGLVALAWTKRRSWLS